MNKLGGSDQNNRRPVESEGMENKIDSNKIENCLAEERFLIQTRIPK